jgi:hypothetical protein
MSGNANAIKRGSVGDVSSTVPEGRPAPMLSVGCSRVTGTVSPLLFTEYVTMGGGGAGEVVGGGCAG